MILRMILAVMFFCFGTNAAASAQSTPERDWMAIAYSKKFGVDVNEARQRLQTQRDAGNIASEVIEAMGQTYSGMWFDKESGRFKIAFSDDQGQARATNFTKQSSVSSSIDLVEVENTWSELLYQQERVAAIASEVAETSRQSNRSYEIGPDVSRNEVYVGAPRGILEELERSIRSRLADERFGIAFQVRPKTFSPDTEHNCEPFSCGRPLQGGVAIESGNRACTAGVVARGNWSPLSVWLITAGHCFDLNATVYATNLNTGLTRPIGPELASRVDRWGDFAAIRIDNTNWYSNGITWKNRLAFWGMNEKLPVANVETPFVGQFTCHTGIARNMGPEHKCGDILARNLILGSPPNQIGAMTKTDACGGSGDSGGPFVVNFFTVVGILRGSWDPNPACAGNGSFFTETKYIFDLLNLSLFL